MVIYMKKIYIKKLSEKPLIYGFVEGKKGF
jgi:hypothetical protein